MSTKSDLARAISVTFEQLLDLVPNTKIADARAKVENLYRMHPSISPTINDTMGSQMTWSPERKAQASERWAEKRASETFYLYRVVNGMMEETIVQSADAVCQQLGIRLAYLRSRLSAERGTTSFGTGLKKVKVSKERVILDPREEFEQKFYQKNGRYPSDDDYPAQRPTFNRRVPATLANPTEAIAKKPGAKK